MEYIKFIQDKEGTSRPVKDAELTEEVTNISSDLSSLTNQTDNLITALEKVTSITLSSSGWSSSSPYSQTVTVSGVTSSSVFDVGILYPDNCTRDNQKSIAKAASLIYSCESGSGSVTFRATEKPSVNIPLGIRGIV